MKTEFRTSFKKDLKRIKHSELHKRIIEVVENIDQADEISQIPNLKKLQGGENYFRIRLGD